MATSVGDPFPLASYTLPTAFTRQPGPSKLSNVHATHLSASNSDGYVTTAAQGDGIHILNLASLHPVVSHTLGPTSAFACPPITRIASSSETSSFTTYAVLESTQGIPQEERGRNVRVWSDDLSAEEVISSTSKPTRTALTPHRVSSISAHDELPEHVIFLGPKGEVTLTDKDLKVEHTYTPENSNTRTIRTFVFGRRASSFVPSRANFKNGVALVTLLDGSEGLRVVVMGIEKSGILTIAECSVPLTNPEVVDATCSNSGFISLLCRSGEWHSLQLNSPDYTTLTLTVPSPAITLRGLSFISGSDSPSNLSHEVTALSLESSHTLLASVTSGSSPEIALHIWDMQYGAVLASRLIPIPKSVGRQKKQGIELQLAGASGRTQQALLVLTPQASPPIAKGTSGSRAADDAARISAVLVVPLVVPDLSTIANALGRAADTEKWTAPVTSKPVALPASNLDTEQVKCLKAMRTAMDQKRVEAADEAFTTWVTQIGSRSSGVSAKSGAARVDYGYEFVKQALKTVLRTPKVNTADIPYSPKVVRHLLEKRCVSSNMLSGGLFTALRLRRDWESMMLAVKTVIDIPEDDLIWLLSASITARSANQDSAVLDDAMQVDAIPDSQLPSLAQILPNCITYPTSAPALRLAIRRHLSDADALVSVIKVLAEWFDSHCVEDSQLLPERTKKDAHGALIPVYDDQKKKDVLPPLDKIIAFLQTLLDSSFLSLLSYAPSYKILRQIFSYLEPELAFVDDAEHLRAPLEPFVKAHAKMTYEAAHGPDKPDPEVDWRRRRKEAHEQAAIAIGVYQVEELVL